MLRRTCDIYSQISDLKQGNIAKAYAECDERDGKRTQAQRTQMKILANWQYAYHIAIEQRDCALRHVPRGENPDGFTFGDGTSLLCGQECDYSEDMVAFWRRALPIAMRAIARVYDTDCRAEAVDIIHEARKSIADHHEIWEISGKIDPDTGAEQE